MVFPRIDAWGTSAEIPYWWCVTTQIWIVLPVGCSKFSANQKHFPYLGRDASWEWNLWSVLLAPFCGKTSGDFENCLPFSQLYERQMWKKMSLTYMQVCPHSELRMHETFNSSCTRLQWALNKDSLRLSKNLAAILSAPVWSAGWVSIWK